jgi:hypothetical protein
MVGVEVGSGSAAQAVTRQVVKRNKRPMKNFFILS